MKFVNGLIVGISVIGLVLPIELVLAATTVPNSRCQKVPANPSESPASVFCDSNAGACNSTTKIYFFATQSCVPDSGEGASCTRWSGASSQQYTVIWTDNGWTAATLVYAGYVAASCTAITMLSVTTGIGVVVVSILCSVGTTAYAIVTDPIPRCDWGHCKVDYTIPSVAGPQAPRCD